MSIIQITLKWLLTAKKFGQLRTETKNWLMECDKGHTQEMWKSGGIRYKGKGNPKVIAKCHQCGCLMKMTIQPVLPTEAA